MRKAQASAFLASASPTASDALVRPVTLATDALALEGEARDGVVAYLGIPYARPPVGAWRWRAPRPLPAGETVRNLGRFGPDCAQPYLPAMGEQNVEPASTSEDCLYLNVWAPADAGERAYPVMVWLHGGGFRIGGSSLPLYNGDVLAREGVVVVTLNYRLGRLGFLAHPAWQEDGDSAGNFGLLDQCEALRFVRRHIGAFGGDPDNVTLFGESAGGSSVLYLMASPRARGLFDRAIVQSGAIDLPEFDRARMAGIAEAFAANAGLATPDAAGLRALPLETVLGTGPQDKTDTMPFIDGDVVPCGLYEAFAQGRVAPVPLLIGGTDHEAGFFPPGFSLRVIDAMGPARWRQAQAFLDPEQSDYARAARLATDLFVTLGTRRVARAHAANGHATYRYEFAYVPPGARGDALGAVHTDDIPYVFGNALPAGAGATAEALRRRWVAFARSGQPTADGQRPWPAYWPDDETLLHVTDDGERLGPEPGRARLDFLASLDSLQIN
ncbi:carboxylesterase [Halomonas elongata]|uniref:carboxylesterase/lipase family protein n=1 Tax=Halomonas elongata TaxID=2746 RepID=UPI000DCD63A2|nr:carboxylesterase family protein [Halomonas elongata]RAW08230.1 carboxylesterase [Halomonas elongata]